MCISCGNARDTDEFYKRLDSPDGLRNECRQCRIKESHQYYFLHHKKQKQAHNDLYHKKTRHEIIFKKYGLRKEEYERLSVSQNDCCAICYKQMKWYLHVDHNHQTNKIRGLLCQNCNVGIGYFKENPELLRSAIAYLLKHSAPSLQTSKEEVYATQG